MTKNLNLETSVLDEEIIIDKDESVKVLQTINDKELLQLIKKGQDFNLKNIFEIRETEIYVNNQQINTSIEHKIVERTQELINIFKNLGEDLHSNIITRSNHGNRELSLQSLNTASKEENSVVNIRELKENEIKFIQNEYRVIKETITTNVIRTSIIEGKIIENMPLEQVNPYIAKSLNKYKETSKMTKDIININGKEERLIPMIMKNNLQMTIKELRNIDSF